MMEKHYLYKITNLDNGKAYIGVSKDPDRRFNAHLTGYGSRALKEDLLSTFKTEILVIGSKEYIYDLEIKAIAKFSTLIPKGYNIAIGGYLNQDSTGSNNPQAVLTESEVLNIRVEYAKGLVTHAYLADKYDISLSAISKALMGKTWKEVGGPIIQNTRGNSILSEVDIIDIRNKCAKGCKVQELAEEFGTAVSNIVSITTGQTWKRIGGPIHKAKIRSITQKDIDLFIELKAENLSNTKIAEITGWHRKTIGKYLK